MINKIFKNPFLKNSAGRPISAYTLIVAVAVFLTITANQTFFVQVMQVYSWQSYTLFLVSLGLVLIGLLSLVLALITHRLFFKALLIFFVMISAMTGHFTDTYGTVYDVNMLQNALQTDQKESKDLINLLFITRILVLGILPSFLIYKLRLSYPKGVKKTAMYQLLFMAGCVVMVILPILANSKVYASFFREHKPLRYYTNPITPIYSVIKFAKSEYKKLSRPSELTYHAKDAVLVRQARTKPRLMLLIVGETARADHINLNGYPRVTLPKLTELKNKERFYNFHNVMSCGTSTAYSVPCMFSYLGAKDYDVDTASYHENVLDTLHRMNVSLLWRDNNSDDKGVMTRLMPYYQNYRTADTNTVCHTAYQECRDVGMLVGLDKYIDNNKNKDILIILHQMGNHGPAYYKRYDDEFNQFLPTCQNNELAKCEPQALYNAYDNALLATDDFIFQGIGLLKKYQDNYETAMLYLSDHGESLGENGIYLHGMPNAFAPTQQKHIPAFLWLGADVPFDPTDEYKTLSHDNITPTLLKFFDINAQITGSQQAFIE